MADNPVDLSAGDIGKLSPVEQARLIEDEIESSTVRKTI